MARAYSAECEHQCGGIALVLGIFTSLSPASVGYDTFARHIYQLSPRAKGRGSPDFPSKLRPFCCSTFQLLNTCIFIHINTRFRTRIYANNFYEPYVLLCGTERTQSSRAGAHIPSITSGIQFRLRFSPSESISGCCMLARRFKFPIYFQGPK